MPTFNFSGASFTSTTLSSSAPVSFGLGGVTFTLTSDATAVNTASFTGGSALFPFALSDITTTDNVFTLSLASGSNSQFSGTASNPIILALAPSFQVGSFQVTFTNSVSPSLSTQVLNGAVSGSATFQAIGQFTGIKFTSIGAGLDNINIASLTVNSVNCFTAGTAISTPDGLRPVEELQAGDTILTADGSETTVKWLGTQQIDTRLAHPTKVNPIRITAGALGYGLPHRDLTLSADHAVAIDGLLINAGALVNSTTIYQVEKMPMDGFTYYHIETGAHELLLAEGVAAESFIDYAGRDAFENGAEATATIAEMDMPRISTARLVPENIRASLVPAIAAE